MGEIHKLHNQSQLITAIKANNSVALKALYVSNYAKIESLVLNNNGTMGDAKNIYQDAFIVLWNAIRNKTFIPLNESAIQGFLYTVAKNKGMGITKSSRFKKSNSNVNEKTFIPQNEALNEEDATNAKVKVTMDAFKSLEQPCKQLLTSFYYEKKSLRDIASKLNVEENTVINKKYQCLEKLRSLVTMP